MPRRVLESALCWLVACSWSIACSSQRSSTPSVRDAPGQAADADGQTEKEPNARRTAGASSAGSRATAHASGDAGGGTNGRGADDAGADSSGAGGATDVAGPAGAGARDVGAVRPPDWPMYGHDQFNTQNSSHETQLNSANVATLEEKWRVRFQGGATSQPLIYAGTAYFGGWDGRVYAVDALGGELRWHTVVTTMYVRSTPLVTEDRVYVAAGGNLVALDRKDGKILFDKQLDKEPTVLLDGSPKLIDDLVIVGVAAAENSAPKDDYTFRGSVIALDAQSGELVWQVRTTGDDQGPCIGGAGVGVWSSAAFDPELGLMYIGTGQNYEIPAGNCADSLLAIYYAREHAGERIAWKAQYNAGDIFLVYFPFEGLDGDVGASPNLFEANGKPLVGAGDKAGTYRVFDRRTGELEWRVDLDVGDNTGIGGVMTTAAVGGGAIYVASNAVMLDGASTSTLNALDLATGETRWKTELPSLSFGAITFANELVYHVIVDGTFYVRDAATGEEVHRVSLDNTAGAAPSVANGRVYVSTGMAVTPDLEQPADGLVFSFGLPEVDKTPSKEVVIEPVAPAKPASVAECREVLATNSEGPSPACADCLCACNPSAWANCPWCWGLAPCTALFCGFTEQGPELQRCLEDNCAAKLIPPGQFLQNVDAAPCVQDCFLTCAW